MTARYTHKVRVGNWSETWELEQVRLKNFLQKKEQGDLLISHTQRKLQENLKPADLISQSNDGYVHFGDIVMVYCENVQGFLATDVTDRLHHDEGEVYSTSATKDLGPYARNTWQITRYAGDKSGFRGDVLRYGQQFHFSTNPDLRDAPLYLHSQAVSVTSFSRLSRHQEVVSAPRNDYSTVWKVVYPNSKFRVEKEGEPIPANETVLIQHCRTNQLLSCESIGFRNDFGSEYEICTHTHLDKFKVEQPQNKFLFVTDSVLSGSAGDAPLEQSQPTTASLSARGAPTKTASPQQPISQPTVAPLQQTTSKLATTKRVQINEEPSVDDVLLHIRDALLARGPLNIRVLANHLRRADNDGSHMIGVADFVNILQKLKLDLSEKEVILLVKTFDPQRTGGIDYDEVLYSLRGELNARRKEAVSKAYSSVDKQHNGYVTLDTLRSKFNGKGDPRVKAGELTADQALLEFLSTLDNHQPDGFVVADEFLNYYRDVSAGIDTDSYFELLLQNTWSS